MAGSRHAVGAFVPPDPARSRRRRLPTLRPARPLTRRPGNRYRRPGLVIVVIAGILAVTFATGYTATRALSGDDSAWLRKGVTIAHINGPSARYDAVVGDHPAQLAASATDPLQVVQEPNGQVYTADPATRKTFRIDLGTMTPEPGPAGTGVLAAGSAVYIVDRAARTVTPVNPQTLAPGRPIPIPAPIASQTIAANGTVYIGQTDGAVTVIKGTQPTTLQVAPQGDPLDVTVVGTQPAAVDLVAGVVYALHGGQPSRFSLPGPAGGPLEVAPNQSDGPMWLVQGDVLASVDLSNGRAPSAPLPAGDHYGAPVTNGGNVYVPDDSAGQVLVFNTTTLAPEPPIAVPPGAPGAPGATSIELIAKDQQVWIDNPTSRDGKLANPNGTVQTVDKGTGDQVVDPNATPAPPTSAPPSGASGSSSPGPAPTPVASPNSTPGPNPTPIPVTGVAPTAPLPPSAPTPTPSSGPVPAAPPPSAPASPPTSALVPVPTDLAGQTEAAACAELQTSGLACHVVYLAQASKTSQPDVVAGSKPSGGSVAKGTTIELDVDEVAVPKPASPVDPGTYCAQADAAGFSCSTRNLGQGSPTNTVVNVNPPAGTLEPPGHAVVAGYYSTSPPPPPVQVPSCAGAAPSACPMPAGLTAVTADQTTPTAVACNTVWNESPVAGTTVPQGTTVTLYVDPYCAAPLYELHHNGTNIWYLTTTDTQPSNSPASAWTHQSYAAYAYPIQGGSCPKAGTVPLYKWQYPPGGAAGNYDHYYFTDLATWHDPGWGAQGPIACVFNSAASGSIPVYAHYINQPLVPGDWSWELQANPAEPSPVWYQVQHP